MSNPFRATINFFQRVIIYIARIMWLLCQCGNNVENNVVAASQVQREVRYFICYSHRDIELGYGSDIGLKNRREFFKILINSRKLLGFTCFQFLRPTFLKNAQ